MKQVPRYIASVFIQNQQTKYMNVSLGFDKNGTIGLYFGDTAELNPDSNYINDDSFPNSGLMASGMYSMWLLMFMRHVIQDYDE